MTKQELIKIQRECAFYYRQHNKYNTDSQCKDCKWFKGECIFQPASGMPCDWKIERLERESNENRC